MKDYLKLLKSNNVAGKSWPSKELPPGTLYVACLNRPLIDLWAITDSYTNNNYDSSVPFTSSVYSASGSHSPYDDRIPNILSPYDVMMLYNDGLTEYY
jgi:hypothetical protein